MIRRRPLWAMALILVLLGLVWAGNTDTFWLDSTPTAEEGGGGGGEGGGDPPPPPVLSDALLAPSDLTDLAAGWATLGSSTPASSTGFCERDDHGRRERFNNGGRTALETVKGALGNAPDNELVAQQLQRFDTGDAAHVFNSFNSLKARCRQWFNQRETAGAEGPEVRERRWDVEDFDPAFPTFGDETTAFRIVTRVPKKQGDVEVADAPLEAHFVLIRRGDVINLVSYIVSTGGTDRADTEVLAQRADAKIAAFLAPPPPPPGP